MKKHVEIRDLLKYRFPENLQYSPDGKLLAFQVAQAEEEKNTYQRAVWLYENGKARAVTAGLNASLVCWNGNRQMILSRHQDSDAPDTTHLYLMDTDGGEAMPWIVLPFAMSSFRRLRDNVYAAVGMIRTEDPDAYLADEDARKQKEEQRKKDADYQVVDEVPYWSNGSGYTNGTRPALFLVETAGALKVRRLTAPSFQLEEMTSDGTDIYYSGIAWTRRFSLDAKVYVYHEKTHQTETLYGKSGYSIGNLSVRGGRLYCQATDRKQYGVNETGSLCEIAGGQIKLLRDPMRQLMSAAAGDTMLGSGRQSAAVGRDWYTLATEEDHVEIWHFDSSFEKKVLFRQPGAVWFMDACSSGIAFAYGAPGALTEIYEMDLSGRKVHRITDLNTEVLKDTYVAVPQRVDFVSHDLKLHGWVLLPEGSSPRKKIPAVLDVHGGPRAVYTEAFFHEMQVWAGRGYAVLFCNIAGSDGRGDAFADIRDQYGEIDFDNLMDFTDAVLAKYPNIDRSRICETGGSYGGFMTNWIITHTDRFCAAASQRSIANWLSMSLISDIGPYFGPDQCGAKSVFTAHDTEKLWEHSPLKYADQVKTPTLFIHSDEDYRCPLPEGMQMMQALAVRNIETRMVIFHGENHELSRSGKPLHRIRRLEEITGWFDRHTGK
jgi:dipeptidyl aminopeptidase/acylaminoacyl peptidase